MTIRSAHCHAADTEPGISAGWIHTPAACTRRTSGTRRDFWTHKSLREPFRAELVALRKSPFQVPARQKYLLAPTGAAPGLDSMDRAYAVRRQSHIRKCRNPAEAGHRQTPEPFVVLLQRL